MNIGSLYIVKTHFWLLFPTKETALVGHEHGRALGGTPLDVGVATTAAAWYSKRFNCEVTYFSPDSYIVYLEEDGLFKKVLTSEGLIGWVCFVESYNDCFEEVKTES